MRRLILSTIFFITALSFCSAQVIDSALAAPADSTARWYAGNIIPKAKFRPLTFIAPAVLMGYGFAAVYDHGALKQLDVSTKDELQEDHPLFAAHVDDYLQFAPAAAVYALNISGVKGKHNLFDASMLYVTSAAIMGVSTHFVKQGIGRERPDDSGTNSFPSGHTASAFMAAEFLHQEYKDVNPWIGYAGYFVATATGTLRMYNNKHWFSDVVAGAGFGIASTKIAYLLYPYMKSLFTTKKEGKFTLMPFHQPGSTGLMLSGRF
ncbi:phosphatase PAP2 family protein [Pedobacter roseus]|uniref:Phosphatase PAP2 family protein n=1 Tax=Pedobacter roseus TaxID=336820 RepID=A0A7G9QKZ2_9SPHI|nr:phosphatase PAP2 family protein [Pedobacter roseus]QNN44017.1 phosphatase PAP2 family protein [Pedobacter roseus]